MAFVGEDVMPSMDLPDMVHRDGLLDRLDNLLDLHLSTPEGIDRDDVSILVSSIPSEDPGVVESPIESPELGPVRRDRVAWHDVDIPVELRKCDTDPGCE